MRILITALTTLLCLTTMAQGLTTTGAQTYRPRFEKGQKATYSFQITTDSDGVEETDVPKYYSLLDQSDQIQLIMYSYFGTSGYAFSDEECHKFTLEVIDTTPYGTVFSLLIHQPKEKKETDVKEVDKVSKAMTEYLEENKFTMFFPNDMNSWMLVGGKEHWDNLSERMGIRKGTDYDAKKAEDYQLQHPIPRQGLLELFIRMACPALHWFEKAYNTPFCLGQKNTGQPINDSDKEQTYTVEKAEMAADNSFEMTSDQYRRRAIAWSYDEADSVEIDSVWTDGNENGNTTDPQPDEKAQKTARFTLEHRHYHLIIGKDSMPTLYEQTYEIERDGKKPKVGIILRREQ